ncbi:MAG: hypothetical protein Q8P50_15170, partial [Bacillota bacterium]|nr:hypothetical protein [Bacillota bacterium]
MRQITQGGQPPKALEDETEALGSKLDPDFDAHRLAALRTAYQDVTGDLMRHLAAGLVLASRTFPQGSGKQVAGVWHAEPWPDEDGLKLRAQHLWCALFGWRYLVGPTSLAAVRQEFLRAHWINKPLDPSAFLRGRRGQLFAEWCNQHGQHPEEVIAWFRDLKSQDKSFFGASPQTLARLSKSITFPFITVNAGLLFAGEDLPESEDPYARLDQGVCGYNDFLRQTKLADLAIKPADNPIALMAVQVMRTPQTVPALRNAAALIVRRFIADRAIRADGYKDDTATLDTVLADVWGDFPTPVV